MTSVSGGNPRLDAVIFDLDSTLVDTEHLWTEVRKKVTRQAGLSWIPEADYAMMGMNTAEWASYMAEKLGFSSAKQASDLVIGEIANQYATGQVKILPGAIDAVRNLAELCPVGIASSSPVELIEAAVAALGVADLISAVVSSDMVATGKPAPDGYLLAAKKLSADPKYCLAVEDSPSGVRAALNAGMVTVSVPTSYAQIPDDLLVRVGANLASLEQLSPDLVMSLMGKVTG